MKSAVLRSLKKKKKKEEKYHFLPEKKFSALQAWCDNYIQLNETLGHESCTQEK